MAVCLQDSGSHAALSVAPPGSRTQPRTLQDKDADKRIQSRGDQCWGGQTGLLYGALPASSRHYSVLHLR